MSDASIIVCRCEDLTLERLRELIANGYTSLDELKRITRCGMGPCQGRTCRPLIERELASLTNTPVGDQPVATFRQPSKPIKLGAMLGGAKRD